MVAQAQKFILLTSQRCGSTFIRLWINSHPNVRCHSEVFLSSYRAQDGFTVYCKRHLWRRLLFQLHLNLAALGKPNPGAAVCWVVKQFLDDLYGCPVFSGPWGNMNGDAWELEYQPRTQTEAERAVGFQLMYRQLERFSCLSEWIKKEHVSVIHLVRENALKLLLSRKMAKTTKDYHFSTAQSSRRIHLDPETIASQLDTLLEKQDEMRRKFPENPGLEISYEGFFSGHSKERERILSFLDVEGIVIEGPQFLNKLNPDSLEDLIDNYEEIFGALRGTRHEALLERPGARQTGSGRGLAAF